MAHRPKLAVKTRNGSDNMGSHQLAFDYGARQLAGSARRRPPAWRLLFVAGTSPGLWTLIFLGLFLAAALRFLS